MLNTWIQTYTGKRFNLLDPDIDSIDIEDIAHALSMQCRYTGHTLVFYSVAEHSVHVSRITDSSDSLWGLLHDASEAYLGDVASPLKHSGLMQGYIALEERVQAAICQKFGLPLTMPKSVKLADETLLATEKRDIMAMNGNDWGLTVKAMPNTIQPVPANVAKSIFLNRFDILRLRNGDKDRIWK